MGVSHLRSKHLNLEHPKQGTDDWNCTLCAEVYGLQTLQWCARYCRNVKQGPLLVEARVKKKKEGAIMDKDEFKEELTKNLIIEKKLKNVTEKCDICKGTGRVKFPTIAYTPSCPDDICPKCCGTGKVCINCGQALKPDPRLKR